MIREAPVGAEPGHLAKEITERKVKQWRRQQVIYSSFIVFEKQNPNARSDLTSNQADPWPEFESAKYDGRPMTAAIVQTVIGQTAAKQMKVRFRSPSSLVACRVLTEWLRCLQFITLRVQTVHGKALASDDAFKRAAKVHGNVVTMDHTLGTEHKVGSCCCFCCFYCCCYHRAALLLCWFRSALKSGKIQKKDGPKRPRMS